MKRTFASIVVAALILVLGAGTVFASAPRMVLSEPEYALQSSPPGDFLDYYDVENRLTTIGRAHVCDGMETKFVFSNDKGVSLEVKRKDTWPVPGGTTTIGWQLQKGSGTSASLTLSSATGSREIKTYFEYHLEHWAHVEPFPFAPVDVVGLNGLPPGVVTARWDIVREYGWAQAPLTFGDALEGDNAPSSELAQYEGRVHPEYGQVWPASPYGTWTKSYVSGQSLGIAVTAFGYQLEGKTYFNTGTKLEHTFSGKYDRYWGYDRNTGGKEWFFSHS